MDLVSRQQAFLIIRQRLAEGQDAKLVSIAEEHRRQGLGWRWDGLGDWSTEAIFSKLQELGVDTDPERFPAQARSAGQCAVLEQEWDAQIRESVGGWIVFPFFAVQELWLRLTPDLLCPETVAHFLETGVHQARQDPSPLDEETLASMREATTRLIDYLQTVPPDQRDEALSEVEGFALMDIRQWLIDSILVLGKSNPDVAVRIADFMSEIEQPENYQSDLTVVLAMAGREEESLERARQLRERFPDHVLALTRCGDTLVALGRPEEALEVWEQALAVAEKGIEWDLLRLRIADVLTDLKRPEMWEGIRHRHPRPADLPAGMLEKMLRRMDPMARGYTQRSGPPAPTVKVGRNDPCPCGSGQKFKRCCGR